MPNAWENLNETLGLLQSFKCPTVTRMTLVKGYNMSLVDEYAKLVEKANPTYIEAKAYMHIGFSTLRLGFDNMPQHFEVKMFAEELAKKTGYAIIDDSPDSRVFLLSKTQKRPQAACSK
jgi:tRNA wybutosine-synthesizing protein 1